MTHYDRLIDSIVEEIYIFYSYSNKWDEEKAKQKAHKILQIVEEFQTNRNSIK